MLSAILIFFYENFLPSFQEQDQVQLQVLQYLFQELQALVAILLCLLD